ncbi:MAG: hypothetical protein ABIQ64_00545 [Candidatus Saccharimonadales bacterium]
MSKLPMYMIMTVAMGIGGYVPVLFGQSAHGGWSILGTVLGGILGVMAYAKLRSDGIIE